MTSLEELRLIAPSTRLRVTLHKSGEVSINGYKVGRYELNKARFTYRYVSNDGLMTVDYGKPDMAKCKRHLEYSVISWEIYQQIPICPKTGAKTYIGETTNDLSQL